MKPVSPTARGRVDGEAIDLWHLACALFLSPRPPELSFITVEEEQRRIARRLGFTV